MPEQDTVKLQSELAGKIISRQIEKVLEAQKGYQVDIHVSKLTLINSDGNTRIHFIGNAKADPKELKRICGNSGIAKNILSAFLKYGGKLTDSIVMQIIKASLPAPLKHNIHIHINDRKYKETKDKAQIDMDVDGIIKTKYLQEILV